jgi:hypothetical protein
MPDELSSDLIQQPAAESKTSGLAVRYRWIVLGLLIIVQTAFGAILIPLKGPGNSEFYDYMIFGVILVQPILFAIWAVFAPQRYYVRFLWAFLLGVVTTFIVELGGLKGSPDDVSIPIGILTLFHAIIFFSAIFILSIIKRFTGWKIRSVDEGEITGGYLAHQFGIKHIILLTTITALALGLFQSLTALCPDVSLPTVDELCRESVEIVAMFFPVVFLFWFSLIRHRNLSKSILVSIVLIGIIELAVCIIIPKFERRTEMLPIILSIQLGASVSILTSALTLRWCGYRLERGGKKSLKE